MMNLGQTLHAIRLQKGMTQREIVTQSGIPQPNLSNIEKGRDFTVSTLLRLCYALDVSPARLFERAPVLPRKKWMTRQRVEKLARAVWGDDVVLNGEEQNVVRLLRNVVPLSKKRISQKIIFSAWNELRRQCTAEEIRIMTERVRGEGYRRHG